MSSQRKAGAVEISLDPAELENLSKEELAARYDASRARGGGAGGVYVPGSGEDFSDIVAEENARKRSRGATAKDKKGSGGRGKDRDEEKFKF